MSPKTPQSGTKTRGFGSTRKSSSKKDKKDKSAQGLLLKSPRVGVKTIDTVVLGITRVTFHLSGPFSF